MAALDAIADRVIGRCRLLADSSEEPGYTTRTFLSEAMRAVHAHLCGWMERAGMNVTTDHAGNLRGFYSSAQPASPRFFIGSHLDTVPRAGAFDGVLGVILGMALVEALDGRRLPFALEVIGFSDEEGVRLGVPFIGSRALIGDVDDGLLGRAGDAIRAFGLDPSRVNEARAGDDAMGFLEFHIEQGPVLDSLGVPLGIVKAISGQSRLDVVFEGKANHAGTTPMSLRRDALAAAAEWIGAVEREARAVDGAVATVGRVDVTPGAGNVIPGAARASLDARHASDAARHDMMGRLLRCAEQIASARCLGVSFEHHLDQAAVAMDAALVQSLESAVAAAGFPVHTMASGAGHDAMIVARRMPASMLFVRSPGGISHNPDESVRTEDVAAALAVGMRFLEEMECRHV
jgi:allantoate deiminase